MTDARVRLIERIVGSLRGNTAPRSTADLAREFLGVGHLDEQLAEKLLGVQLAEDPRLEPTAHGWRVREGAPYSTPMPGMSAGSESAPLQAALAVLAPLQLEIALQREIGTSPARYCVALGGEAEIERAERRFERSLPRPAVSLVQVARRWLGYRGAADLVQIAEQLGLQHIEGEGLDGHLDLLCSVWRQFVARLEQDGVIETNTLALRLEAVLEKTTFVGRAFDESDLQALPAAPGTYLFRDVRRRALYVGQSTQLAQRVISYFTGVPRDEKDRAVRERAHYLQTRVVATGVDALIGEARWIRRHRPELNVQRLVQRAPLDDGIVAVRREDGVGGYILFVIRAGSLVDRVALHCGARRAQAAATRAASALFASSAVSAFGDEASLVGTWVRFYPETPFLRPGICGGVEGIGRRLVELAQSAE